jgi:hypothetical protein
VFPEDTVVVVTYLHMLKQLLELQLRDDGLLETIL